MNDKEKNVAWKDRHWQNKIKWAANKKFKNKVIIIHTMKTFAIQILNLIVSNIALLSKLNNTSVKIYL